VTPREQGRLQGVGQSLQGLASVLGPILFGMTFAWSIRHEATLHAVRLDQDESPLDTHSAEV